MPALLARQHIPGLDIVVDPCAAILVFIVTGLLCFGIKEVYYASCSVFSIFLCIQMFQTGFIVTGLLCSIYYALQILQSTRAQVVVTTANVCAMIFVIIAGGYLGFKSGWTGYELPTGYISCLYILWDLID